MARLAHTAVVITGASSGIGRATALAFADRGATLTLTARRESALEEVADACRARGARVLATPADVTDHAAVEALAKESAGEFGRIDVWVNNAAVNCFGNIEEVPVDVWHGVVATNLFGTYHGVRAVLPWMREQGSGVIVNVSSVLGKVPSPYQSAYVASKHAIRGLSDSLRAELADLDDIAVCTVLPGPVDTPLFEHAGNYTGRTIEPVAPVASADRVAERIVACARSPEPEVVVGASTGGALLGNRISPRLTERIAGRKVSRDHFGDSPAPGGSGAVLEPASEPAPAISGGWTRTARRLGQEDARTASGDGTPRRVLLAAGLTTALVAVTALSRAGRRWLRAR